MAYVYRHIRVDRNIPFYIGIGSDLTYRRARSKTGRNRLWHRIVATTDFEVEVLIDGVSLEEAKKKEIEFVALYGRINDGGVLANITGGGDGMFDIPIRMRDALKERNMGNKYRLGGKLSSEAKKLIGAHSSIRNSGAGNPSYKGEVCVYIDGELVGVYAGLSECASATGASVSCISSCITGKQKTAKGYTFKRQQ